MPELYTVRNAQGATLNKGQAVYVSGSQSGTLLVKLAKSDAMTTLPCLGLVENSFADGTLGNVVAHGQITSFDTSAWNEGDRLYVSGTVAGGLVTNKPTYPHAAQLVAYVATKSVSAGVLEVVAEGSQPVFGTILEIHAPTHYVGGVDPLTGALDANARVEIQSGSIPVGTRRKINFLNVTAADDPANERVNVTVGVGGGGGGGVNVSAGGNTAGVLTLISTGTMLLAGGNNVTLSQDGNSITFSGPTTVASATVVSALGVSTDGVGNTGLRSGTIVLSGGNNITLSQITGGGNSATIVVSAFNQSVQTQQNIQSIAASNTTYHTGQVEFTGSQIVTVRSSAGQRVVIDASQSVQTQGMVQSLNASEGVLTLMAGNLMSVSNNASSISAINLLSSATTVSVVASANVVGAMASRFALEGHQHAGVFSLGVSTGANSAGNTRVEPGQFVFRGQGMVTLNQSTAAGALNTIHISATQSDQTGGLVLALNNSQGELTIVAGNLIGVSNLDSTIEVRNLLSSATTVSQVNSANVIGAMASRFALEGHQHAGVPALAAGSNTGNRAGDTATQFGTWVIAGTDNITVSGSTGGAGVHTIWLSGGAGGGGDAVSFGVSTQGNTAGTTGSVSRSILFVGGEGVTLSESKNDGASATVTIHAAPRLNRYHNLGAAYSHSAFATSNAVLFMAPLDINDGGFPGNMSPLTFFLDMSYSITATASSSSHSSTVSLAFYTLTGRTLSQIFSASTSWAQAAATNQTASYHGPRYLSFVSSQFNVQPTFSETNYWMGVWARTSNFSHPASWLGRRWGTGSQRSGTVFSSVATATSQNWYPFLGFSTATFTTAMPTSITQGMLRGDSNPIFITALHMENTFSNY